MVQDSLEKLAKNRTTFVIAHRLSTIKNAEKILVLTENGIEEEGTHEELLAKKGIYEKLYHMRFRSSEPEKYYKKYMKKMLMFAKWRKNE